MSDFINGLFAKHKTEATISNAMYMKSIENEKHKWKGPLCLVKAYFSQTKMLIGFSDLYGIRRRFFESNKSLRKRLVGVHNVKTRNPNAK